MKATVYIINTKTHLLNSALCATLLLSVCLYIFYVSAAVNEVVMRKDLTQNTKTIKSDIATLEAQYIEAQHVVSERIASAADYEENHEKHFVNRGGDNLVFSSNVGR